MTVRILAVCAGNICRSPAAEAAIVEAATRRRDRRRGRLGGDRVLARRRPAPPSVGGGGGEGGLIVTGRARRINRSDFARFDMIVVMDRANLREVIEVAPDLESRARVRLFRTFDPETDEDEVPDPYGGPDEGYDRTISMVRAAAAGLVASLASARVQDPVALE